MELEAVLNIFKYLSTPFDDQPEGSAHQVPRAVITSPDVLLENLVKHCLEHVDFLESSKPLLSLTQTEPDSQSVPYSSWHLTCVILSLLSKLKTAIDKAEATQSEEQKSISVLSIQSQLIVQKSIELVIGFGIVPYLLPGLGVPSKLRKMSPNVPLFLSDAKEAPPYEQFLRLSHVIENLLICSDNPSLNVLLLPKYTSDILAGLMQICKAPIAQPKPDSKPGALSKAEYENVIRIRREMEIMMNTKFLISVPKSSFINSLFLIGSVEKPRWIASSCSELLHGIMLSKNGLILVSSALLESSGRSDTWKLMRVISNLMKAALLKSGKLRDREALENLSEQSLHLVRQTPETGKEEIEPAHDNSLGKVSKDDVDKNRPLLTSFSLPYGTNVDLLRIGLFSALTLMEIDFCLVKSVFWDRLFYHLLDLDRCQENHRKNVHCGIEVLLLEEESKSTQEEISATVLQVGLCATYAELLLCLLKPMNVTLPLKELQPVWSLFLQIFVACERYLEKSIQEPKVAGSVEQLHHKLRDVLILLLEIYASGLGQSLTLPSISLSSDASANQTRQMKERIDLCEFCLMLLLHQGSKEQESSSSSSSVLNKFDFEEVRNEVRVTRLSQNVLSAHGNNNYYDGSCTEYLGQSCVSLSRSILKSDKLKPYWPLLMRQLLSWGTKRQDGGTSLKLDKKFKSDEMPTHLSGGGSDSDSITLNLRECQRFITFKLLGELGDEGEMLEEFGKAESSTEALDLLELLLNKFTTEAFSNSEDTIDSSQLIMYVLSIISAIVESASAASATMSNQRTINQSSSSEMIDREMNEVWESMDAFIPHLRKLTQSSHPSLVRQGIPNMASNLLLTIGTRGAEGLYKKSRSDIVKSRFEEAMEDATSPMIHVKGHGLLQLRKLIEEKDRATIENEVQVLKVFQENLANEDSYVYLMSIQGMATLALKFHKKVVPVLIKEYDFITSVDEEEGDATDDDPMRQNQHKRISRNLDAEEQIEFRMKIGEILVKVIQRLGEIAPGYRVPLTNVFFRLMRDEEPLIRASALSNLGELCHLLKFSLGMVLTEVWYCVHSILSTEKNIYVRRAALHLVVLLLKGVEKDIPVEHILSDNVIGEHLRDVRRFLTQTEKTEVDLVAKTHCQLALQELELIVRKILTPSTSLTYKIQVLN